MRSNLRFSRQNRVMASGVGWWIVCLAGLKGWVVRGDCTGRRHVDGVRGYLCPAQYGNKRSHTHEHHHHNCFTCVSRIIINYAWSCAEADGNCTYLPHRWYDGASCGGQSMMRSPLSKHSHTYAECVTDCTHTTWWAASFTSLTSPALQLIKGSAPAPSAMALSTSLYRYLSLAGTISASCR